MATRKKATVSGVADTRTSDDTLQEVRQELQELRIFKSMNQAMSEVLEWQHRFEERFVTVENLIKEFVETQKEHRAEVERRLKDLEHWQTEWKSKWQIILGISSLFGGATAWIVDHASEWFKK